MRARCSECGEPAIARDLCVKHYWQHRRAGTSPPTLRERSRTTFELAEAVVEFLKRWDDPETYHRLPAVERLRAALPDANEKDR